MNVFLSLLVETGVFEIIEVNFLIVGHTHCILDQYFSTLSKANRAKSFIGTPLALQNLYQNCHEEKTNTPTVNRQIRTFYDYKKHYGPHTNNHIKYYQVPHSFIFKKVDGICVMQYKLYSNHSTWLPREPKTRHMQNVITSKVFESLITDITTTTDLIGVGNGTETLLSSDLVNLPKGHLSIKESSYSVLQNSANIKSSIELCVEIECNALSQSQQRMADEDESGEGHERYKSLRKDVDIASKWLSNINDKDEGYIVWINFDEGVDRSVIISQMIQQPPVINPYELLGSGTSIQNGYFITITMTVLLFYTLIHLNNFLHFKI